MRRLALAVALTLALAACDDAGSEPDDQDTLLTGDTAADTAQPDTTPPADTGRDTSPDMMSSCVPTSCADDGLSCGRHTNHCGGVLSCGGCTAPEICGAGRQGTCGTPGGFRIPDTDTPFCVSTTFVGTGGACPRDGEPWFGQDGTYRFFLPAYDTDTLANTGASVLVDRVTGLRWAVGALDDVTPTAATTACSALDDASQTWRVPSLFELLTVIDAGKKEFVYDARLPIGLLDVSLQTNHPVGASGEVLALRTGDGSFAPVAQGAVLCVSGDTPARQWNPTGTQSQFDESLGLQWTRDSRGPATWDLALFLCEGLTLDGIDDWRLPTLKELAVLLTTEGLDPALDNAANGEYWSATPDAANSSGLVSSSSIFTIDFATRRPRTRALEGSQYRYLCVRSTQ